MLDLIVVTIVAIFLLIGVARGFLREFFGLVGVVLSIIITIHNHDIFVVMFSLKRGMITNILSTIAVYIVIIVIIMIINSMLMSAIQSIRHSTADKIFGLLMGAFKGIVISYVIVFLIQLFYCSLYINAEEDFKRKDRVFPAWMTNSRVYPIFNELEGVVDRFMPKDIYDDIKVFGNSLSEAMEKDVDHDEKTKKRSKRQKAS